MLELDYKGVKRKLEEETALPDRFTNAGEGAGGGGEGGGSEMEEQCRSILNTSMCKLKNFQRSIEPSLLRSVLICNTLRYLEREMQSRGMAPLAMSTVASFTPGAGEDDTLDLVPPPNYDKVVAAATGSPRPTPTPAPSQHTLVNLDTQQVVVAMVGTNQLPVFCDAPPTQVGRYGVDGGAPYGSAGAMAQCLPSQAFSEAASSSLAGLDADALRLLGDGDADSAFPASALVSYEHNYCQLTGSSGGAATAGDSNGGHHRGDPLPSSSSSSSSSSSGSDSDDSSDEGGSRPPETAAAVGGTLPITADFFGDVDLSLYDFDLFCPMITAAAAPAALKLAAEEFVCSFPATSVSATVAAAGGDNRTSNAAAACGRNELLSEELDHIMKVLIGS
ncbi:PREDICTED: uncharacterized protein LOC106804961 [Priapulus caudatus]|uniref:Uncharacterized protein LOC106804961 n=1 Tax=Priapulus caudatus TaxID=37621 RepID=A0ABM1DPJ5_PRICU|nr:PREDICTED: uncharacterized protein LOC106804961 [Priapulus caudatus]